MNSVMTEKIAKAMKRVERVMVCQCEGVVTLVLR